MNRLPITGLHGLIYLVRIIFFPFNVLILPIFIPQVKRRLDFERKNHLDLYSRSFRFDGKKADVTFEVASEGELEQIRPVMEGLLAQNFLIELIYASSSVEKKCEILAQENNGRIRILRLPLLTFFVSSFLGGTNLYRWRTGKVLILCRYDFYPELMLLGARKSIFFILLSATLKGKEASLSKWWNFYGVYLKKLYAHFDLIVAASEEDKKRFLDIGTPSSNLRVFDFRVLQILNRLSLKEEKFSKISSFKYFQNYLENFPYEQRIILGSAWPNEMEIFKNSNFLKNILEGEIFVSIAPHKISRESMSLIIKKAQKFIELAGMNVPIYQWGKESISEELFLKMKKNPGILFISHPGILCELYTFFAHSFIGGGHGRSIHSVLEPYVAGSKVYCGPKVFRSTEYDLILEKTPSQIHIIEKLSDFHPLYLRFKKASLEREKREELFNLFKKRWQEIYSLILFKLGKVHGHS